MEQLRIELICCVRVQRGGQGNVHLDDASRKEKERKERMKSPAHEGLADKLKHKLLGKK